MCLIASVTAFQSSRGQLLGVDLATAGKQPLIYSGIDLGHFRPGAFRLYESAAVECNTGAIISVAGDR